MKKTYSWAICDNRLFCLGKALFQKPGETPWLQGGWVLLRPVQTVNVSRPNIIKHFLVTKHADVEVSGQTVKTCLIKHRSNYGYKPLSKRGTHARAKHVWYGCPNEQNIAHQTREQQKCFKLFDGMFDGLQIFSNKTEHDQTRSNSTKQGGQTVTWLVTKQRLMMFGHQTFPVWIGLYWLYMDGIFRDINSTQQRFNPRTSSERNQNVTQNMIVVSGVPPPGA